jgi:CDGSH iron-sulfur domain-containing protein 3
MPEPHTAQKSPYLVELAPGTYWWCACGRSKNQPFCDGSHQGSAFTPVKLEVTETASFALCGCKHSGNRPHCDGTHRKL